jgi:hypothetical protein
VRIVARAASGHGLAAAVSARLSLRAVGIRLAV